MENYIKLNFDGTAEELFDSGNLTIEEVESIQTSNNKADCLLTASQFYNFYKFYDINLSKWIYYWYNDKAYE